MYYYTFKHTPNTRQTQKAQEMEINLSRDIITQLDNKFNDKSKLIFLLCEYEVPFKYENGILSSIDNNNANLKKFLNIIKKGYDNEQSSKRVRIE